MKLRVFISVVAELSYAKHHQNLHLQSTTKQMLCVKPVTVVSCLYNLHYYL